MKEGRNGQAGQLPTKGMACSWRQASTERDDERGDDERALLSMGAVIIVPVQTLSSLISLSSIIYYLLSSNLLSSLIYRSCLITIY